MSERKPLAAAAVRLRRRPGRKRAPVPPASAPLQVPAALGPPEVVVPALCPPARVPGRRLLNVEDGSRYLGVGPRTLRDLIRLGAVPAVKLQIPTGGRGRPFSRLLIDVLDLDALILASKVTAPEPEPARVARMRHARAARLALLVEASKA